MDQTRNQDWVEQTDGHVGFLYSPYVYINGWIFTNNLLSHCMTCYFRTIMAVLFVLPAHIVD